MDNQDNIRETIFHGLNPMAPADKTSVQTKSDTINNIPIVTGQELESKIDFSKVDKSSTPINFGKSVNTTNLCKIYGNSLFTLDPGDGMNSITGVLQELPTINATASWTDSGNTTIADLFNKLYNHDLVQGASLIVGADAGKMTKTGGFTTRIYSGPGKTSFNLRFRIYSEQSIGPNNNTSITDTIVMLVFYSMPKYELSVNNLTQQFLNIKDKWADTITDDQSRASILNSVFKAGKDIGNAILGNNEDGKKNTKTDKDLLDRLSATVDAVGKTADSALGKYAEFTYNDHDRIYSTQNVSSGNFGGNLWLLNLMPGIFKNAIPVFISNWSFKFSKELNKYGNGPVYADFEIGCEMDQVKYAGWWLENLSD